MTDRQSTHAPGCWGWGPKHYECAVSQIERLAARLAAPPSAPVGVDFAAVASILRRAMRDGVHYGYRRDFILQQALALEALSQQPAVVEEISEDDIANIAWEVGFCLEKEDAEGEPTEDWQWLNSEGENMFPDLVKFSRKIAALATQQQGGAE